MLDEESHDSMVDPLKDDDTNTESIASEDQVGVSFDQDIFSQEEEIGNSNTSMFLPDEAPSVLHRNIFREEARRVNFANKEDNDTGGWWYQLEQIMIVELFIAR